MVPKDSDPVLFEISTVDSVLQNAEVPYKIETVNKK